MANVLIFVPTYKNHPHTATMLSVCMIQQHLMVKGHGVGVSALSFPDISELRSMVLALWYDKFPDCSHLLMIDDDMDIQQPTMILDMLAFGEPVMGAIYRHKVEKVSWVFSGLGKDTPPGKGPFLEVEAVGGGCMLIARPAITTMLEKMPHLSDDKIEFHGAAEMLKGAGLTRVIRAFDKIRERERGMVSEDISFCRRWRECGGKVWGAAGYRLGHIGETSFNGNFAEWTDQQNVKDQAPAGPFKQVDAKHGKFSYIAADTFIGRSLEQYGEWTEFELDLLLPLIIPGDVVIDVGANIGTHTIPFAKRVGLTGAVLAFEPQPQLWELLSLNVGANCFKMPVALYQEALGASNCEQQVASLPPLDKPFNFGALPLSGDTHMAPHKVQFRTIDTVLSPTTDVRLIKIDVEGMESSVIAGARETIRRCQPILYVENNGDDSRSINAALASIGYKAYWSIGPYFNPLNHAKNPVNVWPNVMPSVNLIAVPAESDMVFPMQRFQGADDNWRKAMDRQGTDPDWRAMPRFVDGDEKMRV